VPIWGAGRLDAEIMAIQGIGTVEQQGPVAKQYGGAGAIAETLALQCLSRQVH
jgi:hypothetical protein